MTSSKEYHKKYYQEHKELWAAKGKIYRAENADRIKASKKKYSDAHKVEKAATDRKYREANLGKLNARSKKYYHDNKGEPKWIPITDDELLKELFVFYVENGHPPDKDDIDATCSRKYDTYHDRFGMLVNAYRRAGIPDDSAESIASERYVDAAFNAKMYAESGRGRERDRNYYKNNPEKVRMKGHLQRSRRRGWGFSPINDHFYGAHAHHLHLCDHSDVMYIPSELHNSISHAHNDPDSMNVINDAAFAWFMDATQEAAC